MADTPPDAPPRRRRRDRARSATARLIAAHLTMVGLSTALALGFLYWRVGGVIDAEQRQVVEAELAGLAQSYRFGGVMALADAVAARLDRSDGRDAVYLLAEADGARIAGNLARWPDPLEAGSGWVDLTLHRTDRADTARIAGMTFLLAGGERLLVARDLQARGALNKALVEAFVWALAAMAVLGMATAWLISRMVARRVRAINETAGAVMQGGLDQRIRRDGSGDQFDRLAETLNAMLDRISTLIADLRMVTDSMAHDLRGPLGRVIRRVEAAQDESEPERRAALLRQAARETEAALEMSRAMLDVSRIEAGITAEEFAELDLAALAADAAEFYEAAAEEKGVTLALEAAWAPMEGARQLLAQALFNLIDNALRYAPAGSTVTIGAAPGRLWVADRGPGIPEADRARALSRFGRLDPARGGEGSGLGLSLVAAVARLHGGEARLGDNTPGLVAEMRFPE